MNLKHVLKDSVKDGEIRELHLRNTPVLKNCQNWNDVKELGIVNHKTKYAKYDGLLVRYGEGVYFISSEKMEALRPFRTWNTSAKIKVIDIEKQS